jgi:hypothetical protein
MFKTLILGALLISGTALATHLEKVCESAVRDTPIWEDALIAHRSNGQFVIETHNGIIIAESATQIRGVIQDGLSIWALTMRELVELNAAGDVMNTYSIEETGNPAWAALSMAIAGRKLIISRGAGGLMGFDLEKREITWTNWMPGDNEGYPSGLAVDGEKVYAAVASSQEAGFTGIITVNPVSGEITKRSSYDVARWGVLDTDVKARMHGDSLVLNNGGWIHVIKREQIESDKAIRPRWAAHVIPQDGTVNAHYMMIKGDFVIHGGQVMGCGAYTAQENGNYVRKSKLFHVKLP